MKPWAVIQFSSGDVDIVPTTWVNGTMVFWPPYTKDSAKVRGAIKKREEPVVGWPTFHARVLIYRGR